MINIMRGFLFKTVLMAAALSAITSITDANAAGIARLYASGADTNTAEITASGLNPSADTNAAGVSTSTDIGNRPIESRQTTPERTSTILTDSAEVYSYRLDSIVVQTSRAGNSTPIAYTGVGPAQLRSSSPLNSLPMTLSLQPSVVSTNEGGTGLGYSKMTVRGSKGSQINVTLNGITLNDAESQEVFWVNIPVLSSILSSVQLQRGLGTSLSGAGAFGASINMSTASVGNDPYSRVEYSRGAFNTSVTSVAAGTGLSPKGFYASAAYSKGDTDGYIRGAGADVQSAFAVLGYMNEHNSLRLTYLLGDQRTGITWNGISAEKMKEDRRYNPAGEYSDAFGNLHYYDGESDNYTQQHLQVNYTHSFNAPLTWATTLNYTKGDGYYEQYKAGKKLSAYAFDAPVIKDGISYEKGDFIVNKSMDNSHMVLKSDLQYKGERLKASGGIYLSRYDGLHFGTVVWSNLHGTLEGGSPHDGFGFGKGTGSGTGHKWYDNSSVKSEIDAYARAEYDIIQGLTGYADLQFRGVSLRMKGIDDEFSDLGYSSWLPFFNPRAGLNWVPAKGHRAYLSVALGHREPGRSDIKEVIEAANAGGSTPSLKPEQMLDTEIGYEFQGKTFSAAANIYLMEYKDMLLETGRITDTGYAIKENVPRSWRRGIELTGVWKPSEAFRIDANATLSINEIKDYTAWWEEYDNSSDWNPVGQYSEHFDRTAMLLSPSIVAAAKAVFNPFYESLSSLEFAADVKYVGKQYWDNTSSEDRCIPAYTVVNLSVSDSFRLRSGELNIGLYVGNLLNAEYYADAWVYRAHFRDDNSWYQEEGLFPQAPINCMLTVRLTL